MTSFDGIFTENGLRVGHFSTGFRQVIPHPGDEDWKFSPENCVMGEKNWTWIQDETYLVCPGCGLDGT